MCGVWGLGSALKAKFAPRRAAPATNGACPSMITGTPKEGPELFSGLAARGVPPPSDPWLRGAIMRHLGANVYLWDRSEQNHFLARCQGPALRELRREGRVRRFWSDRVDGRG